MTPTPLLSPTGYISPLPPRAPGAKRRLAVLGATGSIGVSALKVAARHPDRFAIVALAGARNAKLLAEQAARFRPAYLAVLDNDAAAELRRLLPGGYTPHILTGPEAYVELARLPDADTVLSAIVGGAGLPPTFAAVQAGKTVALANKESLVLAGHLFRKACAAHGSAILPVDSEHSALFQAMNGEDERGLKRLVLTASGGPFRALAADKLATVTRAQALNHPNWSMGAKISIDSATLMNKGLEVIEACHLFGLPESRVATVVHPQSIVHSLAEFVDGSLMAHLGPPDMQVAIAYALLWPERLPLDISPIDLVALGSLTFEEPRMADFPCLGLARESFRQGPSHCAVLNAANEAAVELFLHDKIAFCDIPRLIEAELGAHRARPLEDVPSILALDREVKARILARKA